MKIDIQRIINSTKNLPSLPGVAVNIIRMVEDPEVKIGNVVSLLSKDPAITSRILRVVNSPLYVSARPGGVETLKEAVVIMGLDATLNLALSFTLLQSLRKQTGSGLDYEFYWRRALLSALAAKVIGAQIGVLDMEQVFLAGLLQDIGMLVVDRVLPGFYDELGNSQVTHEELIEYERTRMYTDHAQIGGLMLNKWSLPKRTSKTVLRSHDPADVDRQHKVGMFVRCVALSGHVADLFLSDEKMMIYFDLIKRADSYLCIPEEDIQNVIDRMVNAIPVTESLFAIKLVSQHAASKVLEDAHKSWMLRVSSASK